MTRKILLNSSGLFLFSTATVVNTLLLDWGEIDQRLPMTGSTKILTVSYGTFSCTLEGFDDPLESMRDIAEYFRDLAADDRYFGAEPPTPDVEMLQSIAERQAQRQVDARTTDTGVALVAPQQGQPTTSAPAIVPSPAPEAAADGAGPLAFDDEYLMSDEPEDILAVSPNTVTNTDRPAESVAEKLRRIRAVVSQSIEEGGNLAASSAVVAEPDVSRDRAQTKTINDIASDLADDEEAVRPVTVQPQDPDAGRVLSDIVETISETSEDEEATEVPAKDAMDDNQSYEEDDADTDEAFDQTVSDVLQKLNSVDAEAKPEPEPEARPTSAQRAVTKVLTPKPDADVGRLLDETDTKLNDDETVRRRRVISQMRAAVAATKADRIVTPVVSREAKEEAEKTPYRGDLSEVVKGPTKTEDHSTPPLMLVSSQRVHDPDAATTEQINAPAPEETPEVEKSGFADFALSVGAKELDELLEAAAAYTVFAEGQPTFTRPEIMKRVAHADPGLELTREDSLRSFGQLLRKGKFKKLERGQFTIDEDTRFHPSQQIAGE